MYIYIYIYIYIIYIYIYIKAMIGKNALNETCKQEHLFAHFKKRGL